MSALYDGHGLEPEEGDDAYVEDKLPIIGGDPTIIDVTDGVVTRLLVDEMAQKATVNYRQDVEPHLDNNKALYNHNDGYSQSREWRRVASVPPGVQLQMIAEYGADPFKRGNETLLRRVLNDPKWRYLRTAPGRI